MNIASRPLLGFHFPETEHFEKIRQLLSRFKFIAGNI